MPRGGFRETARGKVGRPISPATLQARIEALNVSLARPQLARWSNAELAGVRAALTALSIPLDNEHEARAEQTAD